MHSLRSGRLIVLGLALVVVFAFTFSPVSATGTHTDKQQGYIATASLRDSHTPAPIANRGGTGTIVENFANSWHSSVIGLTYDPVDDSVWYAHEDQVVNPTTIWNIDRPAPHTTINSYNLSALNAGFPVALNDRDGAAYDPAAQTFFLPDYQGDLTVRDDNIVEINRTGTILNAWEIDGASNDSSDGSLINTIIDIAIVPGTPNRYFVAAGEGTGVITEIALTRAGLWTAASWSTVGTCTVAGAGDVVGLDYDATLNQLAVSSFSNETITYVNLSCVIQDQLVCNGPGSFHTGVTIIPGTSPREVWVTDFTSNSTSRCVDGAGGTPTPTVSPTPGTGGTYCSTAPLTIPDANPTGATSVINVADSATISDLNVSLDVTHTWVGDLVFTLNHGATTAELYDQPGVPASTFGCSGDNFVATADDEGATSFEAACTTNVPAFPVGNYIPGDPAGPNLAAFDGANVTGTWTLTASDLAAGDTGTLNQWCLITGGGGGPTATPTVSPTATVTPGANPDINVSPASVTETHDTPPETTNQTLTIGNTGGATLEWSITEVDAPKVPSESRVVAPIAPNTVSSAGRAPITANSPSKVNAPTVALGSTTANAYRFTFEGTDIVAFPDILTPGTQTSVGATARSLFSGDYIGSDTSTLYVIDSDTNQFLAIDTSDASETVLGTSTPTGGESWSGLSYDASTSTLYGSATSCASSTLYTINQTNGTATVVGTVAAAGCLIDIAVSPSGQMYGVDIISDVTVAINKATGVGTVLGSTGIDANFAQGMDFDDASGVLYYAAFNNGTFNGELRTVDLTTGNSTLVGAFGADTTEIDSFAIAGGAAGTCPTATDIPWLTVSPTSGSTAPGGSSNVTLTFNSTGLTPGSYTGTLCVESNDPDEAVVEVPVTLIVEEPPTAIDLGSLTQATGGFRVADIAAAGLLLLAGATLLLRRRK